MLIDSNILIYSVNNSSPKQVPAQKFLKENSERLEFSHQNILEAVRVLTHAKFPNPMNPTEAADAILKIVESGRIVNPNMRTLFIVLELIKKYSLAGNRIFDAYLAATLLSNGIDTIATDNIRDFQKFPLKVIDPFS